MKNLTNYSKDELTSIILLDHYRITALEMVLTHFLSTIPDLINKIHPEATNEKAKPSDELKDAITSAVSKTMIKLIMKDEKLSESLKEEISKSVKF